MAVEKVEFLDGERSSVSFLYIEGYESLDPSFSDGNVSPVRFDGYIRLKPTSEVSSRVVGKIEDEAGNTARLHGDLTTEAIRLTKRFIGRDDVTTYHLEEDGEGWAGSFEHSEGGVIQSGTVTAIPQVNPEALGYYNDFDSNK